MSVVLWIISVGAWTVTLSHAAKQQVGADVTQEQLAQAVQQMIQAHQVPTNPIAIVAGFAGGFCAIIGLGLAIRSLRRREGHPTLAVIACIVSVGALIFHFFFLMAMTAGSIRPLN
ncbi:MAG: hypothetical protein FWC56_02975 [Phycisphaerae bacterium]|nr:hypothetical protein [Phycisphaerae bacterium]